MHKSLIAFAFLLLTGCGASSLNQLHEQGVQSVNEIPVNYQAAFRNLRQQLDKCIGLDGRVLTRAKIDNQLYTDIQEGHFTWVMTNAFSSSSPMIDVRIKAIDSDKTSLTITTQNKTQMNAWHDKFVSWSSGDFVPCR